MNNKQLEKLEIKALGCKFLARIFTKVLFSSIFLKKGKRAPGLQKEICVVYRTNTVEERTHLSKLLCKIYFWKF